MFLSWAEDDRSWAVALLEVEADECPSCRQPRSESMDKDNEYAYTATPVKCHACAAVARESRRFTGHEHANTDGLTFNVTRGR